MSEILDLVVSIAFMTLCSVLVRGFRSDRRLPSWWLGIAIVPLLAWGISLAVILLPRPISEGWQAGELNTGRADSVAILFYGVVLPAAYLVFAVPITFLVRLLKSSRLKK
ncbi:MAG: hypothetical protein R3E18_13015 [Sphingomonadaceae bacterium]|nr:hypothetical protein [Sphingomonadaceae bacterium]